MNPYAALCQQFLGSFCCYFFGGVASNVPACHLPLATAFEKGSLLSVDMIFHDILALLLFWRAVIFVDPKRAVCLSVILSILLSVCCLSFACCFVCLPLPFYILLFVLFLWLCLTPTCNLLSLFSLQALKSSERKSGNKHKCPLHTKERSQAAAEGVAAEVAGVKAAGVEIAARTFTCGWDVATSHCQLQLWLNNYNTTQHNNSINNCLASLSGTHTHTRKYTPIHIQIHSM